MQCKFTISHRVTRLHINLSFESAKIIKTANLEMKTFEKLKNEFDCDAKKFPAKRFKKDENFIDNEETATNTEFSIASKKSLDPESKKENGNLDSYLPESENDDYSDNAEDFSAESEQSEESDDVQKEAVQNEEPNDNAQDTDCSEDSDKPDSVTTAGSIQAESSDKSLDNEKIPDSDNEPNSYSSISFENSDEDFDNIPISSLNVEEPNQSRDSGSPEPLKPSPKVIKQQQKSSGAAPSNTETCVAQASKKQINNKSKLPTQLFCQGPLSFIAEAMKAVEPASKRATTETRLLTTDSHFSSFNSQPTEVRKKGEGLRTAEWVNSQEADNNDSSSSSSGNEAAAKKRSETKRNSGETKTSNSTKMSAEPKDKEAKSSVLPAAGVGSDKIPKDLDSDDSLRRRKPKTVKAHKNNNKDFYEDDSTFEDDKLNSEDDEDDKFGTDFSYTEYAEYESFFEELRKLIDKVPKRFKYEISRLLYPALAVFYLRAVASGKFRKGKEFVDSQLRCIDQSYMSRVDKLMTVQSTGDIPKKAKKYISDDNEQIAVSMSEETYQLFLIFMQSWSRPLQTIFLRHFDLVPDYNCGVPRQQLRISSAILERVYWATSQALNEKFDKSSRPRRRRRFKNHRTSPSRNINLPTGNRLYTPFLKRWDLERHKDDEERRVPLSRDNLPSAYLYTAYETVETVICASFSSKSTMLSIGTASATINVFSLTSSKLVQLKSAKYLKMLDTSVSGIDENMLDESKRKMRRILYGHQGPVYDCSFAPNDRFLLSCSQDRTVRCWCLLSWNCVVIYPGHCAAIYSVIYAPLGYYFATCSDDCTARIWTQDNKKSLCILVGHLAEVVCCLFHPNRHYLATGSADCTVRLWDIIKAVQVRIFSAHKDSVNALAFSMCGRFLVSGADDNFIIVWDTDKEEMVRCLPYHTGSINCIEFALDNKLFVVGGQDCQMTLWDFERLIYEYDPDKSKQTSSSYEGLAGKPSEVNIDNVLIRAYASKDTPFYKLRFTNRNLLLGFCVKPAKDAFKEAKKTVDEKAKHKEWQEFLDILILKACFAETKREETADLESPNILGTFEDDIEEKK